MDNIDPFAKLLVSESQTINKQELADLLAPYLSINKETKAIVDFSPEFRNLSNENKILIVLSAVKARNLIFNDVEDRISPIEIIRMEIAAEGSVKATLKRLFENKEIKSENKKYYIPNYKITQVINRLKNTKNE